MCKSLTFVTPLITQKVSTFFRLRHSYVDEAVEKGLTEAGFKVRMIKMSDGVKACPHSMLYTFKVNEKNESLEGIFFQTFRNGEEEFEGLGEAHPDGDMRTVEIRIYAKEFGERMLEEM